MESYEVASNSPREELNKFEKNIFYRVFLVKVCKMLTRIK